MRKFLLSLILMCIAPMMTQAQDETGLPVIPADGWTYQEMCLTSPEPEPKDWILNGTLLLGGPYGIHGYHEGWDSTHVLAFNRHEREGITSSVSPDGQWYVKAVGERKCSTGCINTINMTTMLMVYSLEDNNFYGYNLSWQYQGLAHNLGFNVERITWLDNTHFAYYLDGLHNGIGIAVVDATNGAISAWDGAIPRIIQPSLLSPDHTRLLSRDSVIDVQSDEVIRVFEDEDFSFDFLNENTLNTWSPDSQYFLATHTIGADTEQDELLLFDRDGNQLDHILTTLRSPGFGPVIGGDVRWSPDSTKLLMTFPVPTDPPSFVFSDLHLVDLNTHQITGLCEKFYNYIWSPDSTQVALVPFPSEDRATVYDIETGEWYTLIPELSHVIGWRMD